MRLAVSKVAYKSRALLPRPRREEVVVSPFLPIIHLLVETDWVIVCARERRCLRRSEEGTGSLGSEVAGG